MIRGRERFVTQLYMLTDIFVIQIVFLITWVSRFYFFSGPDSSTLPLSNYYFWNGIYTISFILIALFISLYASKRKKSFSVEVSKIIQSSLFSMFVLLSILFLYRVVDVSRIFLISYFISNVTFIILYRYLVKRIMRLLRSKGFNKQYILVIGAGALGKKFLNTLEKHPEFGFDILGFLDDRKKFFNKEENIHKEILGNSGDLQEVLEMRTIDEVVVALPLTAHKKYREIIMICEKAGIRVSIIPDYYDVLPANPHFENFGDLPVINVRDIPLDDMINKILKRAFDIVFAIAAIILLSPILVVIALGVKITTPGPVLFKQERVGLNRRNFMMYKFRSMKNMSETLSDTQWTVENDPRRTKFGSFLRKSSLDELPQFFNVLKGDMSVVGPRPERPYFVDQFKQEIPKYMIKHQVRPGITGWAQVSGYRGDTSITKRIEFDIFYLENWTLLFDIKIVLKTVVDGFINKNAY